MSPAELLTHFHRINDAPDAVPRLRRFILDLAVRGRLGTGGARDEPAADLVNTIQADVERRIAQRDYITPRNSIEIRINELPFTVPLTWGWVRLIEIADVCYGFAFESPRFNSGRIGKPLIRIRDISGTDTEAYYDGDFDCEYVVRRGDYLVGMDGDFNVRRWRGPDALLNQRVMRINNWRYSLVPEFLVMPLQMILDHLHSSTSLTTVKHLSAKQVNGIYLPLPPLAEQHRIIAKVAELMALCDRLEAAQAEREKRRDMLVTASLNRLNEPGDEARLRDSATFYLRHLPQLSARSGHVAQLRQTIRRLAVRGRLVAQYETDESGATAIARLGLSGTVGAPSVSRMVTPPNWTLVRFNDVAEVVGGVTLGRTLGQKKTVTLPYLRVANVKRGTFDLTVVKEVTIHESEIERYALQKNDLLMTEGGDWDKVGRAAIWTGEIAPCLHQNHIFRARMRSAEVVPRWFEQYFNSPDGRAYFEDASKQTTNLASINMRQVRGCMIPFPPIAEQIRILSKLDALMSLCDRLEAQLATAQAESKRLLEVLLDAALNGATPDAAKELEATLSVAG